MCIKTVVKLNLSKNAPLSVDMQKAVVADQASIKNEDATDVDYVDVTEPEKLNENEEENRILKFIAESDSLASLEVLEKSVPDASEKVKAEFARKKKELKQ
jgi:recombination protein RecT